MITTYVQHRQADYSSKCANCDQQVTPGMMIYWHGRSIAVMGGAKQLSANTHEGCFWDSKTKGPAPHLSWQQIVALQNAVNGHQLPDDFKVQRLMGALRLAMKRRPNEMYRGDRDAGLRMGPDLLEGYRVVLKTLRLHHDPYWVPVEANGQPWTNPEKVAETTPPRMTAEEWQQRQDSWTRLKPGTNPDQLTPEQMDLQEQFSTDGFWVKGNRVIPVKIGSTTATGGLWIRPLDQPQGWRPVSARQVFMDQAEADEDARNWRPRAAGN